MSPKHPSTWSSGPVPGFSRKTNASDRGDGRRQRGQVEERAVELDAARGGVSSMAVKIAKARCSGTPMTTIQSVLRTDVQKNGSLVSVNMKR